MSTQRILIVDDEPSLARVAAHALEKAGFQTVIAHDGEAGLQAVFDEEPDLILLDIMMPGPDGYEVCQRIRDVTDVPIIMLTALKREDQIIRGLELGADDYIVKPLRTGEFVARVKAALRRVDLSLPGETSSLEYYEDNWLTINIPHHLVKVDGKPVNLSATEFNLLALLLRRAGQVVTFEDILKYVWGPEYLDEIAYVRVYVSHVRRKIEPDSENPTYIQTERQIGYRFVSQGDYQQDNEG